MQRALSAVVHVPLPGKIGVLGMRVSLLGATVGHPR